MATGKGNDCCKSKYINQEREIIKVSTTCLHLARFVISYHGNENCQVIKNKNKKKNHLVKSSHTFLKEQELCRESTVIYFNNSCSWWSLCKKGGTWVECQYI